MSLRCCVHTGLQLAAADTCGARCGAFPACLPAIPAEAVREVGKALSTSAAEHQTAAAVAEVLEELDAAITQRLTREVAGDQSRPRW